MESGVDLLQEMESRLRNDGLRVSTRVALPDGQTADLYASRTYFSWNGLVIMSQHVIVRDYGDSAVAVADAQELFDTGFAHAKKTNRIPLLRGMQFGYIVIPCLIVSKPGAELVQYAVQRPRKHWALFEFPVVIDRTTLRAHYYDQTAMWGAFYFSEMRRLVKRCIALETPG